MGRRDSADRRLLATAQRPAVSVVARAGAYTDRAIDRLRVGPVYRTRGTGDVLLEAGEEDVTNDAVHFVGTRCDCGELVRSVRRSCTGADGLADLAKQYGTTPAVLEKVLKAKGKHVRLSTGTDSFFNSSDITPQSDDTESSTAQGKKEEKEKAMSRFEGPRPAPNPKSIFSNLNPGVDPRIASGGTSPLAKYAPILLK